MPTTIKSLYLIGSLRNPDIPIVANEIEASTGIEVFDDWYSPGPQTDEKWKEHEQLRGRTFLEALHGPHAVDVFEFDKTHLDRCDAAALLAPSGKSAHMELGYVIGKGKPGFYILEPENDRWDVMLQFATKIFASPNSFISYLKRIQV